MPDKVIDIPGLGPVAFPDSMGDDAINAAAAKLYAEKNPQHPKPDPAHSWIDTAVDWLPAVGGAAGGIIGGIGGTVAGLGVGGLPGAVAGATVGGAGGEGFKQAINAMRGKPLPSSAGQQAQDIATQGAIQGGSELVGAGIGRVMKPAGEVLMQSALKPGLRVALKATRAGEVPAVVRTLLDEGVNVTKGGIDKLNAIISASNEEIKNAIANIPFDVNPFKVASRLGDTARRAATQVNPEADLAAVSRVGQEFIQNHPDMIPGATAQALKTGTYRQLGDKAYTGELKGTEVEAQKALARGLKEEIEAEMAAKGVDIAAPNAREGAAMAARDSVARRVAVGGNANPMGIAGLALSHPVTFLAAMMDRSPVVKSMLARGLYSSAGAAAKVNPQLIRAAVHAIATGSDDSAPTQPGANGASGAQAALQPTIGAARVGDRYIPPSFAEIMTSRNPAQGIAENVLGPARPRSVQALDPYGAEAYLAGTGPAPGMILGATGEVGEAVTQAARGFKGAELPGGRPLQTLDATLQMGPGGRLMPSSTIADIGSTPAPDWMPEGHAWGGTGLYSLKDEAKARLATLHAAGAAEGIDWSAGGTAELLNAFGGDKDALLRWARSWGAMSPATNALDSTRESVAALHWTMEHPGEPLTVDAAHNLIGGTAKNAPAKVPNFNRSQAGVPLSGDKVEAMAGFMAGQNRLPIDVHAIYGLTGAGERSVSQEYKGLRALMTKAEGLKARNPGGLTDRQLYLRYEDALRRGLAEIAPGKDSNAIFADFWEGVRLHKGLPKQGGPVDMLRKQGLLEFGAMLDPARLKAALLQKGWTKLAVAGVMSAIGASAVARDVDEAASAGEAQR